MLVAGFLVALAFPHLVSAYHLEAGGRATQDPSALADDLSSAVEHLQRALEWVPDNAQAYRLLAGVYREQGEWTAAVRALTQYTEVRPDNPLGHIELAEVYEEIEAAMEALDRIDLLPVVSQAEVQAPEVPLDTPHGQPDGPAWQTYVAETTFSLPPGYGDRPTLFMHAPSQVTYTLALPEQPMVLRFDMGMDPQTHGWPGDGVTFEVFVDGERVFLEHVDKAMARAGWHVRTVDLARWAGMEVALSLAVTPGPAADPSGDRAGWGEPQVVDARHATLEALQPEERAIDEWQRAEVQAADLIAEGNKAFARQQYGEAARWYTSGATLGSEVEPSVLFRWAISAIMAGYPLPPAEGLAALPVYRLAQNSQIEAETLRWVLADAHSNIHYGDPLMLYSSDPTVGVLWWEKPAVAFVQVQQGSAYRLTVRAKHSIPGPGQLQIERDFSPVAQFSLAPTWQDLEAEVDLSPGQHIIGLRYDDLDEDADGDAILDWIRFERVADSTIVE